MLEGIWYDVVPPYVKNEIFGEMPHTNGDVNSWEVVQFINKNNTKVQGI